MGLHFIKIILCPYATFSLILVMFWKQFFTMHDAALTQMTDEQISLQ